ncbi:Bax inhibitor-1 family protein [Escherichia coli]|nr:Bax inhibitor-1 family protein [Escherichia coli]
MIQKLSAGNDDALYALFALTGLTLQYFHCLYCCFYRQYFRRYCRDVWRNEPVRLQLMKRDSSGFGNMLFMALIGIVLASLVNPPGLKSEALMWAVTAIGVIVFVGLTAYDTQKLKIWVSRLIPATRRTCKYSILGALTLYLDFINLF